jgi:hypothetical protein
MLRSQHSRRPAPRKVFSEKVSGAVTDRKALGKALAALGQGDVLVVTRLDRLARSNRDLLNVLATMGDKGAGFRSLADTWADTTSAHGRLMITILGGLAEFERSLILARTGEGRTRAMARGVSLREETQIDGIPGRRSDPAPRGRRGHDGYRQVLRRQSLDHFKAAIRAFPHSACRSGVTPSPEARRAGVPVRCAGCSWRTPIRSPRRTSMPSMATRSMCAAVAICQCPEC